MQVNSQGSSDKSQGTRPTLKNPKSAQPTKKLPHRKCSSKNQFKILKAAGTLSGNDQKPISVKQIAEISGTHPNTVSACNPFFIDIGLIAKTGHQFVPSLEVVNYSDRLLWSDSDAGEKLSGIIGNTWFAEVLRPRLLFSPLTEDEAVAALADASSASPKYRTQLLMLLDYLEFAGLVTKENGSLEWVALTATTGSSAERTTSINSTNDSGPTLSPDGDPNDYRIIDIPLLDSQSAKIILPNNMDESKWEIYEAVYKIYIDQYKIKDIGKTE